MASKVKATTPAPATNGSLPNGWRMVRFDELAQMVNERVDPSATDADIYVGLEHLDPDSLKLRRWGTPSDVIGDKLQFRKGDIIFGRRRAYQRKLVVAEFDGICSAHAMVVRANSETVEPEFLPFLMQSDLFMQRAIDISVGSLSPTINWKTLRIQKFPLPPKDEQRRIAHILWAADELCQRYSGVCDKALHLANSIASEFFNRQWPTVACEKLFTEGPRNGLSPNCNAEGHGFPTLAIGAVREGRIVAEGNVKYAEISTDDLARFRLRTGDVLVVRGNGNRNLCGRSGIVELVPENCFYPDLLIRLSFDSNVIDPGFAVLQWNTPQVHARLLQRAKSTNGIWKINGKDLREHTLAVPPLDSQKKFMLALNAPNSALANASDALRSIEQLKYQLANELLREPSHVH